MHALVPPPLHRGDAPGLAAAVPAAATGAAAAAAIAEGFKETQPAATGAAAAAAIAEGFKTQPAATGLAVAACSSCDRGEHQDEEVAALAAIHKNSIAEFLAGCEEPDDQEAAAMETGTAVPEDAQNMQAGAATMQCTPSAVPTRWFSTAPGHWQLDPVTSAWYWVQYDAAHGHWPQIPAPWPR